MILKTENARVSIGQAILVTGDTVTEDQAKLLLKCGYELEELEVEEPEEPEEPAKDVSKKAAKPKTAKKAAAK